MKIGNVSLQNNIFLAPMAGVCDSAFRSVCRDFGAGLVYSEMISAKGLHYGSRGSVELYKHRDNEEPFCVQIFGSEPDLMAEAAKRFESMGAAIIDINMGCPVPKIVNNGEGSFLLTEPRLVGEIVESVAKSVKIPVTVKMRRGFNKADGDLAPEIAKICEESGASAVCVHGRFRDEYYSGSSDLFAIANVKKTVNIPVIASGDIIDIESAKKAFEVTGCDGIMIGRGALGRPWIFEEILMGKAIDKTRREINEIIKKQMDFATADKGEKTAVAEMRKHIAWYLKGVRGSAALKNQIFSATAKDEIFEILKTTEEA